MKSHEVRTTIDWNSVRRRLASLAAADESTSRLTDEHAQAVLAARAVELARVPADPEAAGERLNVVTFRLAGERYALEAGYVREIVRPRDITPVPGTSELLIGVMNLRGSVLAVMDLARLLGAEGGRERPWVAVLGTERAEFGIAAEEIGEVANLRMDQVLPAALGDSTAGLMRGVTREALIVLDGAALLDDPRLYIDETN
jgi:purine-binding chemotaxis protein CheW